MPGPVVDPQDSLYTLLTENSFTHGQMKSNPLAAAWAVDFDASRASWAPVNTKPSRS